MATSFDINMIVKSNVIDIVFKSSGQFRIYQLFSTANLALFEWSWAGLAFLIT